MALKNLPPTFILFMALVARPSSQLRRKKERKKERKEQVLVQSQSVDVPPW